MRPPPRPPPVPPHQFALFRIGFGLFLAIWLARLVPFAPELFSDAGLFPDWPATPLPNPFRVFPGPGFATGFVAALAGLAALYTLGLGRRLAALALWYGLSCLVARTSGILNPSLPFIGWLLLASALVPAGEPWALRRRGARPDPAWRMPPLLFHGAWWILALAYTASGWDKLASHGWATGIAARTILGLPFARDNPLVDAVLALPDPAIRALTWGALGTELLFAPLALWRPTRILVWCAGVALHLGLLAMLDFAEISIAMLFIHAWTFDARWLEAVRSRRPRPAPA